MEHSASTSTTASHLLDHREQRRTQAAPLRLSAKDRHVDQQTVRVVGGGYWLVKSWHHHMNTTVTVNEES
jgi:hypothetical protein